MGKRTDPARVVEVCEVLEALAPLRLAQSWDNVGLLAGDHDAEVRRIMLCIDLTGAVVEESIERGVEFVVAYHPPLFKPIRRLTVPSDDTSGLMFRCIRAGVAVYSTHTALDAAEGGTNDRIAGLCGITETQPLEYAEGDDGAACKIVVFVPADEADGVAEAMFAVGAGRIGDYRRCSFRLPGTGTFYGGESTRPAVGEAGRYETVEEIRLESVTPRSAVAGVVEALRSAHSYDEAAFDIYPLRSVPERGIGRRGALPKAMTLGALAGMLMDRAGAACAQIVGEADQEIARAVICVGAAGSLPFKVGVGEGDVIITGEIRHHDALTIRRKGCCAIALGHWTSERPVLESFGRAVGERLPSLEVIVSEADSEPFAPA